MELSELVGKQIENSFAHVISEASAPAAPLTFQSISDAIDELKKIVIPISIWCVDRQDCVERLCDAARMATNKDVIALGLARIQVYEFYMMDFDKTKHAIGNPDDKTLHLYAKDGKMVFPYFCRYPGVYIPMSDGTLRVVTLNHRTGSKDPAQTEIASSPNPTLPTV